MVVRAAWWLCVLGAVLAIAEHVVDQQLPRLKGSVLGSPGSSSPAALCLPGQAVQVMASPHLSVAALKNVHYDSDPPTSGPHFALPPPPGIYDSPLPPGGFVHAEEHGHVIIVYPPHAPPAEVTALKKIAKAYPADVLLTPYLGIDQGVALAAWGRLERLDHVDRPTIVRFITALAGRYAHKWTRPDSCGAGR